jgi:IS30 family transposase
MKQKLYSQQSIAETIEVPKSLISREIKRNCDKRSGKYVMDLAQHKADERKKIIQTRYKTMFKPFNCIKMNRYY